METVNRIYGIVILAAGASRRLGRPKQLLGYAGKTLLQRAIETATEAGLGHTVVVLGAAAEMIEKETAGYDVEVVINNAWDEGMASSLRMGLERIQAYSSELEGVVFMVCDQPFVQSRLLKELVRKHEEAGKPIVSCRYGEVKGTPAFFHKSLFPELLGLLGDTGARKILQQHGEDVVFVEFPAGITDIDTEEDYAGLGKSNQQENNRNDIPGENK